MSRLIDLDTAIESMANAIWLYPNECYKNLNDYEFAKSLAELGLRSLPPAKQEIIICKYCKHLQKWRSEESAKKFGQIYTCAREVLNCPKLEDFCSKAERRKE